MRTAAPWMASAALAFAAACPLPALADQPETAAQPDKDDAATAGGLTTIGIGIAITPAKHGDSYRHDSQWDSALYGQPFTPAANVVCVPNQRQCYERGYYSYSWSKRTFGITAAFDEASGSWDGGYGDFGSFGVDLERARAVCIERSAGERLRNVTIDEAKQMTDEWAYVYMRARPNPRLPGYEKWRCAYSFRSGKTDFKRM